jgi:hypothetical protein
MIGNSVSVSRALGEEQALRLRIVHGRDAEFLLEDAAQVPVGDAQRRRELREARILQTAVLHQPRGRLRQAAIRIDHRIAGRELRPAAKAGTEALGFGGGGAREEAAVAAQRRPGGAHRTAVDPRRAHAHEEAPIEAGVVGAQRAVALVGIEEHGAIIRRPSSCRSPFSDMESGNSPGCRVRA